MNFLGNDRIKNQLKNAIENKKVPSSFLFIGPPNIGKSLSALEFTKELNCNSSYAHNAAENLILYEQKNHPDFEVIKPIKSSIKIDQIKKINEKIRLKTSYAAFRVIVLKDVELLGIEAANAFLKMLEEPPKGNIFILCTSKKDALLPTILSRCTKLYFEPLKNHEVQEILSQKYELNTEQLQFVQQFSTGCIPHQWLKDIELVRDTRNLSIEILNDFLSLNSILAFQKLDTIITKQTIYDFLRFLLIWFYDCHLQSNSLGERIKNKDLKGSIQTFSQQYSQEHFTKICSIIEQTESTIKRYTNKNLALEALLIQIRKILTGSTAI